MSATIEMPSRVTVHERRFIGDYELATISSAQPDALVTWLKANSFMVDTPSESVIAEYVKQGWVFSAVKLSRPDSVSPSASPHPLAFVFSTEKPVYPLRLTGTHEGSTSIDLYVFGPGRAVIDNSEFRTIQCCATDRLPENTDIEDWQKSDADHVALVNPQLRSLVPGTPVATRLSASLTSASMSRDAYVSWEPFSGVRQILYTQQAVRATVLNWSAGLFSAISLIIALLVRHGKLRQRTAIAGFCLLLLAVSSSAYAIYRPWPKTNLRPGHGAAALNVSYHSQHLPAHLDDREFFPEGTLSNMEAIRNRLHFLLNSLGSPLREYYRVNNFTGRPREEGDSPGEYRVREASHGIEYVWYDHDGGEHTVPLNGTNRPAATQSASMSATASARNH